MKTFITSIILSALTATAFAQQKSTAIVPAAKQAPVVVTTPPTVNSPPPVVNTPPPAGATPPPSGATPPPSGATPPPTATAPAPGTAIQPPVGNNQNIQPGLNQSVQSQFQQPAASQLNNNGYNTLPTNNGAFNANGFNGGFGAPPRTTTNYIPKHVPAQYNNITPGQLYPTNSPVQPKTLQH